MNTYVIFAYNPDADMRADSYVPPYKKVGVYKGRTAREALTRFAADEGIEIGDGPASGKAWLKGRKNLASFGAGQYHADKTTVPQYIDEAK